MNMMKHADMAKWWSRDPCRLAGLLGEYEKGTIEEGKRRVMFDQFMDVSDYDDSEERCQESCSWAVTGVIFRRLVLLALFVGILYVIALCEKWNLATTVYYAIITGS